MWLVTIACYTDFYKPSTLYEIKLSMVDFCVRFGMHRQPICLCSVLCVLLFACLFTFLHTQYAHLHKIKLSMIDFCTYLGVVVVLVVVLVLIWVLEDSDVKLININMKLIILVYIFITINPCQGARPPGIRRQGHHIVS